MSTGTETMDTTNSTHVTVVNQLLHGVQEITVAVKATLHSCPWALVQYRTCPLAISLHEQNIDGYEKPSIFHSSTQLKFMGRLVQSVLPSHAQLNQSLLSPHIMCVTSHTLLLVCDIVKLGVAWDEAIYVHTNRKNNTTYLFT